MRGCRLPNNGEFKVYTISLWTTQANYEMLFVNFVFGLTGQVELRSVMESPGCRQWLRSSVGCRSREQEGEGGSVQLDVDFHSRPVLQLCQQVELLTHAQVPSIGAMKILLAAATTAHKL